MVGFEKALGAVKVIKDRIQYRSQSLLNLARDYFSSNSISLALLMVLVSLLTYAVFCIISRFPVFESKVLFSKVTCSVIMNLNLFIVFSKFLRCDSTTSFVFVKWFNGSKLSWISILCYMALQSLVQFCYFRC